MLDLGGIGESVSNGLVPFGFGEPFANGSITFGESNGLCILGEFLLKGLEFPALTFGTSGKFILSLDVKMGWTLGLNGGCGTSEPGLNGGYGASEPGVKRGVGGGEGGARGVGGICEELSRKQPRCSSTSIAMCWVTSSGERHSAIRIFKLCSLPVRKHSAKDASKPKTNNKDDVLKVYHIYTMK